MARTPRAELGQLELYQQQTDLTKIHKPAGPETSIFLIYPSLTNTSHFYIALGNSCAANYQFMQLWFLC